MGKLRRDIGFGLRMLARNKGFTGIAILVLALGIGPNVAIFSIVWATFLAPLPYPHPDELVVVWTKVKGERNPTRADDYLQYRAQSNVFQRMEFGRWDGPHLTNDDHTQEDISGGYESPGNLTGMFGIRLAMGRDFLPQEGLPGNDHEVILSHKVWLERYQGDPKILGKQIRVDDQPYTVVGVEEAGVRDRMPTLFDVPSTLVQGTHYPYFGNVFGRLKPGVTIAQAQAEMSLIDKRIGSTRQTGDLPKDAFTISVEPLHNDWLDKKLERNLWLLLAAVGFVLLIACANLANLLLARGSARQQELAVRSAMGASRGQIFTQLITESLSLAIVGGTFGILLGWGLMNLAMVLLPDLRHQTAEAVVGMNLPVLCFAVGVTLLAGVVSGCAPAWHAGQLNLSEILKQGSRAVTGGKRMRTQRILVVAEFALALTLLSGAGMALHSFWNLTHVDLGVRTDHILMGYVMTPKGPPPGADQTVANARLLLGALRSLPNVQNAALTTGMPLQGHGSFPFAIVGKPVADANRPVADLGCTTPGYFDTFGIQLIRGRYFDESDRADGPGVVMVSQSFVERYLQGVNPLDQRLLLPAIVPNQKLGPPVQKQIIGVFHDVSNGEHLNDKAAPAMLVPFLQNPWPYMGVAVRTALSPTLATRSVRDVVAKTLPGYSLVQIQTMQEVMETQLSSDRFGMVLFAGFAILALLLAALGIYGVMAFAVAQRNHEIGLRMALGAQRDDVVRMILADGMKLALMGVGLGLIGGMVLGDFMHTTLYGVAMVDPVSFVLVAAALLGVGMAASYLPARRSAGVDPIVALRQE
jgi:putative ABC transport system permease protein